MKLRYYLCDKIQRKSFKNWVSLYLIEKQLK